MRKILIYIIFFILGYLACEYDAIEKVRVYLLKAEYELFSGTTYKIE